MCVPVNKQHFSKPCHIKTLWINNINKKKILKLQLLFSARPYFPFSIGHRLIDPGKTIKWRCKAVGRPNPTYSWYKNGELVEIDPGHVDVLGGELIISNVSGILFSDLLVFCITTLTLLFWSVSMSLLIKLSFLYLIHIFKLYCKFRILEYSKIIIVSWTLKYSQSVPDHIFKCQQNITLIVSYMKYIMNSQMYSIFSLILKITTHCNLNTNLLFHSTILLLNLETVWFVYRLAVLTFTTLNMKTTEMSSFFNHFSIVCEIAVSCFCINTGECWKRWRHVSVWSYKHSWYNLQLWSTQSPP